MKLAHPASGQLAFFRDHGLPSRTGRAKRREIIFPGREKILSTAGNKSV
jgi:hypothetical protein